VNAATASSRFSGSLRGGAALVACAMALLCAARCVQAQVMAEGLPAELEGLDIVEKLDARIPLDLKFADETGRQVALGEYFNQGRPVVLTLVYYECPMLCNEVLNGLTDAMNEIDLQAGKDFTAVTVSFDPGETPELASRKKAGYMMRYSKEADAAGWMFHTGTQESVAKLTEAVGFGYRYTPGNDQYAHGAAIMFLTPDGRLSRYIKEAYPKPEDVKLALIEASEGRIGSRWDRFILWCYHYDPEANSYVADAMKLMRLGGVATMLVIGIGLFVLWRRDRSAAAATVGVHA
jgi:protein SCO1/2